MERFGDISIEILPSHVARVTIHRPPHNYINRQMTKSLGDALLHLDSVEACRSIVLQAEGKNFCAGAHHDPDDAASMEPDVFEVEAKWDAMARLFSSEKPIVAAINGAVVGAGFGLAMLADFRVAAPSSKFAANFVKIGFCPGFGLPVTLPRVVGPHRAAFILQTGRRFTAAEVEPWALVDLVVPEEDLTAAAERLAEELAGASPLGMRSTRRRMRGDLAKAVRESLAIDSPEQTRLRHTEDHFEGVRAYRERRAANFVGR